MRPITVHVDGHRFFSIPLAIGLLATISAIVALCARHARSRVSRKPESSNGSGSIETIGKSQEDHYNEKFPPRSPLRSPKALIATISNKALNPFAVNHKKNEGNRGGGGGGGGGAAVEEGFGEGGLWQREILMGVKCQPPEFSGVMYYDCDGNRISEFPPRSPRSPRISASPNFSFPVTKG